MSQDEESRHPAILLPHIRRPAGADLVTYEVITRLGKYSPPYQTQRKLQIAMEARMSNDNTCECGPGRSEDTDPFGICPQCINAGDFGAGREFVSTRTSNLVCCEKHKCYWKPRGKYHPNWEKQTVDDWVSNATKLCEMTEVDPRYISESERWLARRDRSHKEVLDLYDQLTDESQDLVNRLLRSLKPCDCDVF